MSVRRLAAAALVAACCSSPCALAAPCAGFTDVDDPSDFCQNVDWLKNRAITLGCHVPSAPPIYCPKDNVSRLQMAAFLNRLGTALTPTQLPIEVAPGAIDLDPGVVVCQTPDFAVTDFPRRAYVDLAADLAMSTNAGASWTNLNAFVNRGFVTANQWGSFSDIGFSDVAVGQTVRWGVRMTRGGIAGATDLADSRCQLRVLVYSRDGAASPF
jgi:hypothetical protein